MMHIDGSSLLPSIESFQFHITLASTPKRSNKPQPLSSTLSMPNDSNKQFELSISAITLVQRSPGLSREKYYRRQRNHIHPSMIIKRIELKYLLYSSRTMKHNKQRQYTNDQMKIYVI